MPIERNIRSLKESHTKINKSLRQISAWQVQHQKEDFTNFDKLEKAISKLPSEDLIKQTITETIKVVVNGKIDDVKAHLVKQDTNLETLSAKINPIDGFRHWLVMAANAIMYIGGIALAIAAIVELLKLMGVL